METIKIIFLYLFFGLSFLSSRGQQIGNYISNGNFEECINCTVSPFYASPKSWSGLDSGTYGFQVCSTLPPLGNLPYFGQGYQFPKSGNSMIAFTFYCDANTCLPFNSRSYAKNRLKQTLKPNTTYCVKYYVNNRNNNTVAIDAFGVYFGGNSLDTITYAWHPLTYLNPQIQNSPTNIVADTLNFVAITGTFVASGNEKYAVIGNFKSNSLTNTLLTNPTNTVLFGLATDIFIEDVTCIEFNLPAFAGQNQIINLGDSVFIGRQPDWAIDPGCIWYKLPNLATPLDTISGLWVKPSATSTYVVRQELDCSPLKWDTVVVTINTNFVGLDKLQTLSDDINLFPNPTSGNLSISGFIGSDISSFSISNNLGQNIQSSNFIQKNNSIIIETSELESGLYQIHLKTQYGIVTKKFVKTN